MKYSEISNLEPAELKKRLAQNRQALFTARMKHKMQRLSNMMELREGRRDIARLNTALSALPETAEKAPKSSAGEKKPSALKSASKKEEQIKMPIKDTSVLKEKSKKKSPEESREKPVVQAQKGPGKPPSKKTKKWFGFFGSKTKSSQKPSAGKRSFFRRKSG